MIEVADIYFDYVKFWHSSKDSSFSFTWISESDDIDVDQPNDYREESKWDQFDNQEQNISYF